MAYDEYQEERINRILKEKNVDFHSKKMMARIGTDAYEEALEKEHVNEMNFTGRAMKGYVFVDGAGLDMDEDLEYWIQKCIDFNPMAKSSKKKKKK